MRYFSRFFGRQCDSCPQSQSCPDAKKAACPGPKAHPAACPPRTRLTLETLESREVFSVNPVVAENLLPGTPQSQWDVIGNGDLTIQGFATEMSVVPGQAVQFKITNTALAPYKIDVYRLGYYGGLGARLMGTVPSSQTLRVNQPAPLTNSATGLVDAGNWSVTASWTVPSTALSGVYVARVTREDNGGASHIIFVVRDDERRSDVLFQTSDSTWQAYNNWGGKSTYDYNSDGQFRAYAVSYNRPLLTRGGGSKSEHLFWSEYPMIRWMEANGYDVSYTSSIDTDRRGAELLEHKVFLSVGHDEYWSAGQRANVEAAQAAGVNLGFFTGNTMYWKHRWENSIDGSGTPYRTLVTYKESTIRLGPIPELPPGVQVAYVSGIEDPSPSWTGLWRDTRFANDAKVEQLLLGQIFSVNRGPGFMDGTAIQVPADYADMRLWRNTSVADLQTGQVATLAAGTLGYEWDEDVDNGYRPAGTINMSSTTENVPEKIVDPISWPGCGGLPSALCAACRGCAVAPGTATHNLVQYRAPSGALVFNTGTVQWSWGLDGAHDGRPTTPDVRMQQATVNIFADMGVKAGSIRPGLVQTVMSTDLTRPTSTLTSPAAGSNFTAGVPVTVTGTAADFGGGVVGGVEVTFDGGQTWRKATGRETWSYTWTPTTTGPAQIRTRAADDSGNIEIPAGGISVNVAIAATSTAGLVASYNFNAGSGTTAASGTGTNHGTIANATWTAGGMFGTNALSFNGSNAMVTVPDSNSLDLTSAMTLEAWVKPTALNGWGAVLTKENSTSAVYTLYASDSASQPPSVYVGSQASVGNTLLPLNTWSHLAATYDGSFLTLYVNGVQVGNRSLTGGISTSSGALQIGGNNVFDEFFAGLIDEVRIYNRALTQGEILADMSTPVGGSLDSAAPTAAVSNPGGTVSGTVTLSAAASDNVAVAGVQFLLNGQALGAEDTVAPFGYQWNTTGLANGSYTVRVRARDHAGNTTLSAPVTLTVSNAADATPPGVALTNLTANAAVGGTVVLSAVASDNRAVAGVQFKANGVNIGAEVTAAPYRVVWSTVGMPSGTYTITAVARDLAGNLTTSASIPLVVDAALPVVTGQTPAPNATAVATNTDPTVTFSESIEPSSLSFVLRDAGGNPVPATVTYNDATRTAVLHPLAALTPLASYTLTVSGVTDLVGNALAAPVSWSFTVDSQIVGATIWGVEATPAVPTASDTSAIEVGVKFRSSLAGMVTGLRFYKGAGNTGTHVGHLWSADGTPLASATFTGETASGWQQVNLSAPVAIAANTTYVVSYYAPNGGYSVNPAYFAARVNSYPLSALSAGEAGGNGVYRYGAGGGFPSDSHNSSNYWVDVVFTTSTQDTTPPAITARTPAAGATGVPVANPVTVTFSEPVQANTITLVLRDLDENVVPATVTYDDATLTATLTPTSPLDAASTYTVTVSGARDAAGNLMPGSSTWSFLTGTPVVGSSGSKTIWADSATPTFAAVTDFTPIEVGVRFSSDIAGYITGLRFYKGAGNTGTHVGHLWSADGTPLASATFTGETASGWQQVNLSAPVAIAANTTYVVSYYSPDGYYAVTPGYFNATGATRDNLSAPASTSGAPNGLYRYGAGGGFPTGSYNGGNYWVDVVFNTSAQDTSPPAVTARTPADGATGVPIANTVTVTFGEPVQAATVNLVLRDSGGAAVPASVTYDAGTRTATLTPTAPLAYGATYTATVSGVTDASGNQMPDPVAWSFTTATPVTNATLWPSSAAPEMTAGDTSAVELGVRFFSEVSGYITGLRFYKGSTATGTHVGHLWTNSGVLLATATFTSETGSGWQQVDFSVPVAIAANTLYVASYYAPEGRYAVSGGYFAAEGRTNGYLHAPATGANGGNGLYAYGGGFPTNSYNSTNYWVDVVFSQGAPDATAPTVTAVAPADNTTGVAPTAPVTITFSEPVLSPSIALVVRDEFDAVVPGNVSYNVATRVATFIPATPLLSFMRYTLTLTDVQDLNGNGLAVPYTWSFTTRGIWLQTTETDFGTGTNDGTLVTNSAGGEIQLAPLAQDTFAGTALSATNWAATSWSSVGGGPATTAVADGVLSVGGVFVASAQGYSNTAVHGRVSFGSTPYQHFGLATGLDTFAGNYWAIFSTMGSSGQLYARVNANGTTTDVLLGALPTGFHNYKVQPVAGGFEFSVDGVVLMTIAATFQATQPLKAVMSDFNGTAGQLLRADWVSFESYSTTQTGTFTSTVYDAGQEVTWDRADWTAAVPAGTTLTVQVRTGDTAAPDATWSDWMTVVINMALLDQSNEALRSRFLQYRVVMTTTVSTATPVLSDISITWA